MIPDIDQQQLIIRPRFYKELGVSWKLP